MESALGTPRWRDALRSISAQRVRGSKRLKVRSAARGSVTRVRERRRRTVRARSRQGSLLGVSA